MSDLAIDQMVLDAKAAGILPASATRPEHEARPWPVILLTGLGAWLAAIPLIMVVATLFSDFINKGLAPYIVGGVLLAVTVMILRVRGVPLFLEQLAVPGVLVGGATLGMGLFRDMPNQAASTALALCAAVLAWLIPRPWLRVLFGAAMCGLAVFTFIPNASRGVGGDSFDFWLALHLCVAVWLGAKFFLDNGKGVSIAETLESLSVGWILVALGGLAVWSGMTFLVGANAGFGGGNELHNASGSALPIKPWNFASLALAACGVAWLGYRWPTLRQTWSAGVALVFVALAWLMPGLGAVLLVLALCVTGKRWRLAAAAAVAAAWIIGGFYYQLQFPLATKAILLTGAGAVLGLLAWLALRTQGHAALHAQATPVATSRRTRVGIAVCLLAVLMVANGAIWQKEDLIANGRPIYVELAPVDPRSLMQGDYMRLNFNLPVEVQAEERFMRRKGRPHVVAKVDARGVATVSRVDDGSPLASDEIRIELTSTRQGWTLVTDAWYFKEGEAERWSRAKYGEFRVASNGRALLVGMRGPALEPLRTYPALFEGAHIGRFSRQLPTNKTRTKKNPPALNAIL
ncbi:GDYXXLXY domain-containing protein, partial [Massilia glaciei]